MSISPHKNPGSKSSSSAQRSSQSPFSDHGCLSPDQHHGESNLHHQTLHASFGSLRIFDDFDGQVGPTAGYSDGSSSEVNVYESQNDYTSETYENSGKSSHHEAATQAGVGFTERREKFSVTRVNVSSHQTTPATSSQGRMNLTGRKGQMVSGNHLLNFHYDPIPVSRPQPRAPPARRQRKRKPYNKDLFLQANYKFVLLDSGNHELESMDPDKMLCWEDIICLKYSTSSPVHCPICLEGPLCPQITSCGHIFCFSCILQYFSMDEYDDKAEYWKKCPLCFTMISSKDLYTIRIESVEQHRIGGEIEFVLLTRQKDSFTLSVKNNEGNHFDAEIQDSFSKFSLTSDVDLSVREAMSDLDNWLARAYSGLVDDIEKLPYVCSAMKQLEQRKNYWNEHHFNSKQDHASSYGSPPTPKATVVRQTTSTGINDNLKWLQKPAPDKVDVNVNESLDHDGSSSSSFDENKNGHMHPSGFKDIKDVDSYHFYQAVDGQHLILHPLNMKCLLHHYGSFDKLPNRITGKILQLETVTQSEAMRRRYRFLSHFSLTTTFQFCEIDLCGMLPTESLYPFMDEIKSREKQRKRLARKESKDKIKAESSASQFLPTPYYLAQSSYDVPPSFSMEDFEALGSPPVTSSSPPTIGERQSFSSVARLGFAAGHDSPALKTEEGQSLPKIDVPHGSSDAAGFRNTGSLSFASVTSRAKPAVEEGLHMSKVNESGKKGKKSSRVLLSTAGGRRY
ncbi:RING finger 10 isoform X2 [Olea europaea subsp. europaea]|uniref:RING finger 10 isoform X2 n=1 Tax=Olea europaea subsp. europaea TaxID=158383 RepID=A0A8S0RF73_OLEEU|nr:RING finger 10 isoform X2 [Olea europaea subsp. europaea]